MDEQTMNALKEGVDAMSANTLRALESARMALDIADRLADAMWEISNANSLEKARRIAREALSMELD